MDENKQIEEMAEMLEIIAKAREDYANDVTDRTENEYIREGLFDAGYVKQSVGKWKFHKDGSGTCSECHTTQKNIWDYDNWQNFCGHCGAKMTKGE